MEPELTEHAAEVHVKGICFKTGPPAHTGVEREWLVRDPAAPGRPVPARRLDTALTALERGGLPGGSVHSQEPGGQVGLSAPQAASLPACVHAAATDAARLQRVLAGAGLSLAGVGLDLARAPPRVLDHPRHRAMEAHFDRLGPWGRMMMRATVSVQVSLDAGDDAAGVSGYRHRWWLAHRIGPVLVAAFANSPLWKCGCGPAGRRPSSCPRRAWPWSSPVGRSCAPRSR